MPELIRPPVATILGWPKQLPDPRLQPPLRPERRQVHLLAPQVLLQRGKVRYGTIAASPMPTR